MRDRNAELRRAVREAIEAEVKSGNVRVILWLADRLKLITPPSERTPERELREILGGLSQDELHEFEGRATRRDGLSPHVDDGGIPPSTISCSPPHRTTSGRSRTSRI